MCVRFKIYLQDKNESKYRADEALYNINQRLNEGIAES